MQGERKDRLPLMVIGLLGVTLGWGISIMTSLTLKWVAAGLLVGALAVYLVVFKTLRGTFMTLLIMAIPLGFNYHVVFRPDHIGVADGITIEMTDVCLAVLTAVWLFELAVGRAPAIAVYGRTTLPALLLLIAGFLSCLNTSDPDLTRYGLIDWFKGFLFYFYLANNVRNLADAKRCLLGIQIGVLLIGTVCLIEVLLQTNINAAFQISGPDPYTGVFRAAGFNTPTNTGGYLAAGLPLVAVQLLILQKRLLKALAVACLLIGAAGLLVTLTRAAWLCLVVASIPFLYVLLRRKLLKLRHLAYGCAFGLLLLFIYREAIFLRMDEGIDNLTARIGLVRVALNAFKAHPLFGIGLNTYHQIMADYTPNSMPHAFRYVVHHKFLLVLAETGILGLAAFLWIWVAVATSLPKWMRNPSGEVAHIALGLLGSLTVLGLHMNFELYAGGNFMLLFWFAVALTAALGKLAPSDRQAAAPAPPADQKVWKRW